MDRLIAPNSVDVDHADTAPATGTPGYATDGNPATGVPATLWPSYQYNAIQEELIALIDEAGLTPNNTTNTQVRDAVLALFAKINGDATETFSVAPATASQHAVQLGQATGRLLNVQVFTSSGTYTPTAGTTSIIVEGVGGGGGGGGAAAAGTGLVSLSGSGGGGTYGRSRITSGFTGTVVTIGAAGAGATAGANIGGTGGTTSFGSSLVMPGGTGGGVGSAQTVPYIIQGYASATAVTGVNINLVAGGWSGVGIAMASNGARSGVGGDSYLGRGAVGVPGGAGQTPSGSAGYGGGGSGGVSLAGGIAYAGGNGSPGILIIWEYA